MGGCHRIKGNHGPHNCNYPGLLISYKSGIKTARNGGVGCAFDDGTSVREERDLIRLAPELQDKIIVLYGPVGLKPCAHLSEVHRPASLMDLDGVPPT